MFKRFYSYIKDIIRECKEYKEFEKNAEAQRYEWIDKYISTLPRKRSRYSLKYTCEIVYPSNKELQEMYEILKFRDIRAEYMFSSKEPLTVNLPSSRMFPDNPELQTQWEKLQEEKKERYMKNLRKEYKIFKKKYQEFVKSLNE